MRCNCENTHCEVPHADSACQAQATIACQFIGGICAPCAEFMPDQYLKGEL